ncbi:hypothetical protein RRG08_065221 [Elysia crispata]|uniref:Apolipoprotein D n=1 Tax=Elysia crispata TaxID=231223 RepID=A0AAE0YI18_9GAST|nr:hypothetical protein RRG08_065221 [Elysia crispata]
MSHDTCWLAVFMTMKTAIFLLMLWIASVNATFVITEGKCPDVSAQSTLSVERYLGIWYEYMRFPAVFEPGSECTSATYTQLSDGVIGVTNEGYIRADVFGRPYVIDRSVAEGYAEVPDPNKPAELSVSFPPSNSNGRINYKVLSTDYDTYAVVFSCEEIWSVNIQFAWILTRERGLRPGNLANIQQLMSLAGINTGHFITVDQEDCPDVGA